MNKYVQQWKNQGYCVLDNIIERPLLNEIESVLHNIKFPDQEDFGFLQFPTNYDCLNYIAIHPKIISFVKNLLDYDDILLIQSDVWSKKNNLKKIQLPNFYSNSDQRIHMDYPNNYLTHPQPWDNPESVAIIIYYSDSSETAGETALVPRINDKDLAYSYPYSSLSGLSKYKWINDKDQCENYFERNFPSEWKFRQNLYNREIKVPFKKGSILFYRHDLWHRGTPVNLNKTRYVHNIGFKKSHCHYITNWNEGFAKTLCSDKDNVERLLPFLDNIQKKCLGFPDQNSDYWTPSLKDAINLRYSRYGFEKSKL